MPPATPTEGARGEAWAQAQLDKGLPVSFPADWPPEDRGIGGTFVVDALRRCSAMPAPPLFNIDNAVITNALALHAARVDAEVCFARCTFAAPVSFRDVSFTHRLRFAECVFEGDLSLEACRLRELWFVPELDLTSEKAAPGSSFRGAFSVMNSAVELDCVCDGARFESTKTASFNSLTVGGSLFLRGAAFSGGVDLTGSKVGITLDATDATFSNTEATVNLAVARIAECLFEGATFAGPATFIGLASDGIVFDAARFAHLVKGADFNSATIARHASFNKAEFGGPAGFIAMTVGGDLDVSDASFTDAVFETTSVKGSMHATGARFAGKALFVSVRIGAHAFFNGATFGGAADFTGGHIGASAGFRETTFKKDAIFDHCVFGGEVSMVRTTFNGETWFSAVQFLSRVRLFEVAFTSESRFSAVFAEADFHGQVVMQAMTVAGRLSLFGVRARHNLRIKTSCRFAGEVDLRGATLTSLQIEHDEQERDAPTAPRPRDLSSLGLPDTDGCTYDRIECILGLREFWELLRRGTAQKNPGARQPYLQFEQFCRTSGEGGLADDVYWEFRREAGRRDTRVLHKAWNQFERFAFGYGVNPILMLGWFVAIWIAGAALMIWPLQTQSHTVLKAMAVSFANLVPGTGDFVEAFRPPAGRLTVAVGFAQHAIGWALLALVAERFFKGLKR